MSAKKPLQAKLIDQITPGQAYAVVRELWNSDKSARPKIESLIREMLVNVDYKQVRLLSPDSGMAPHYRL